MFSAKILCAAAVIAPAASATWSIVAVNTRTGEVCIASATCIEGINLQGLTPVVKIGIGGACAQSRADSTGANRARIWDGLTTGWSPARILDDLEANDHLHQQRQYGIVNMADEPATFSGTMDGRAYYGVARVIDDVRYAIQGNVLTGIQVITHAENAFLSTQGDLGQKVMAAMEGARLYGGDGRCSCNESDPTYCGCPPQTFQYSAFTAFFLLARIGDVDAAGCSGGVGCASGQYFCDLISISGPGGHEPVIDLENQYLAWRASQLGIADQLQSKVMASAQRLPADGIAQLTVDVELRDIDGNLVVANPATLSIADVSGTPVATVGAVQTVSPGRYRFPVTASTRTGEGRFRITVQHPGRDVLLWPELVVDVDSPAELFCGWSELSATRGASVPLSVDVGAASAGSTYLILASASGTTPGTPFAGVQLPLNLDYVLRTSYGSAGSGRFPGTLGTLDGSGRAAGAFLAAPNLLRQYVGRRFDWSALIYGTPNRATATQGFDVVP